MASASSTVRVAIIGDVKGLSKALGQGEKELGGFGGAAKGIVAGIGFAVAARELADFAGDALAEADRLGDATTRLELQAGDLADELIESADGFAKLGQSAQDILELEAAFADTAEALQLADSEMVKMADDAAATAAAIALLGEQDAATVIDLIGKAAGGSSKAMKALGISVTDAEIEARALATTGKATADSLTDGELAAASYALVLEALKPKLDAVTEGSGDVEQKQGELQARWETLTGKIGQGIEGPLNDFLAWVLAGVDGLERMDEVMDIVGDAFDDVLEHIKPVTDALGDLVGLLLSVGSHGALGTGGLAPFNPSTGFAPATINVNALSTKDTERAVIDAIRNATSRSGELN